MADLSTRDTKLVQYLNEAYGKEKELETALQAHIEMTTRPPYKTRLWQRLTETRRHARELERRVKQLGGEAQIVSLDIPGHIAAGAGAAIALGSKAVATAQGPLLALRGTSELEKMLKNAKTEYADEHEEIATYTAIETLAESVGDSETARLARAIRRDEERMAGVGPERACLLCHFWRSTARCGCALSILERPATPILRAFPASQFLRAGRPRFAGRAASAIDPAVSRLTGSRPG